MSTTYYFHAEIQLKDRWFCLDPIIKNINGELRTVPFKEGGGSYLFETINTLEEYRYSCGVPEDASKELLEQFVSLDKTVENFGTQMTYREYYNRMVFVIDYEKAIKKNIVLNRPHKYRGYVYRNSIPCFEVGELDDLSWLTESEYNKLSKQEQKEYAWYEWDYFDDEYYQLYDIYSKVESLIEWFVENGIPNNSGYSYLDAENGKVRIIVEQG